MFDPCDLDDHRWRRAGVIGGVALSGALAIFLGSRAVHLDNLGLRAAIETTIAISAFVAAILLVRRFRRTRQWRDLLLFGALMTAAIVDLPASVLPALLGIERAEPVTLVSVVAQSLVALAFAMAALAPAHRRIEWPVKRLALAALGATAVIAAAQLAPFLAHAGSLGDAESSAAANHPVMVFTRLEAILLLTLAAIAFLRRRELPSDQRYLLAGAAFLLAVARLQYLALPVVKANWVTPGAALRVVAYGLLLGFAARQHARTREYEAEAAVRAERKRIARDLHDGIAQDLAFIAANRERIAAAFGSDDALVVAARRALDASRGTMVDLSASSAASTADALRAVAAEMTARSGTEITVEADQSGPELGPDERDEVVRIAREAIVNAIKHGRATRITVELGTRQKGGMLLRVRDDGCGIPSEVRTRGNGGFGLPAMRARASSLGGQLRASRRDGGGTEVTVNLP